MQKIWWAAFGLTIGTSAAALDPQAGGMEAMADKPVLAAAGDPVPGYKPEFDKSGLAIADAGKPVAEYVQFAAIDLQKVGPASERDPEGAMGGPFEAAGPQMPATVSSINYPPCDPGPGDDRCIQLYEPGVREALASWNHETGGLAGSQVAMGGPFEPAEDGAEKAESETSALAVEAK